MTTPLIKKSTSISSYQNFDGSNLTIGGFEEKASNKKGSAEAFLGIGTDFKNEGMAVIDFKGSYNYDKNSIINQNLRVRNKIGTKNASTQIRYSPLSVNIPLTNKTTAYINAYYAGKYNYKTNEWNNSAGVFAGITQKLSDKTSLSVDAERYNLQNIKDNSGKNWSINVKISSTL